MLKTAAAFLFLTTCIITFSPPLLTLAVAAIPRFELSRSFETGQEPYNLATGDFNRDGRADLVTANEVGGSISVLLGAGDGTFSSHSDLAVGQFAHFVSIGDVNADGSQDLVVTNGANTDARVSLFLGNGNGTFQPRVDYPVTPTTTGFTSLTTFLALGDFNKDGRSDVVTGFNTGLSVRLAQSNGTLGSATDYETPNGFMVVAVDANGDSNPDLVTAGDGISVFLGRGDGTFQTRSDYPRFSPRATPTRTARPSAPRIPAWKRSPNAPDQWGNEYYLTAGDLNQDGTPDLAVAGPVGSSIVSILLGNADGSYRTPVDYPVLDFVSAIAIGDVTGDGRADVITSNDFTGCVSILPGNGTGAFPSRTDYRADGLPLSIGIRDVNGDGTPDLVTANSPGSISVLLGNGGGSFQAARVFPIGRSSFGIAVGDLDGDGKLDAASANWDSFNTSILFGNGDGTLQPKVDLPSPVQPDALAIGDVNGDGRADLAILDDAEPVISIYRTNPDRTFSERADFAIPERGQMVAIGDVNHDGAQDLVAATSSAVSVLLGNGDGTFQAHQDTSVDGFGWIALGDLNGDALPDVALSMGAQLRVLLGNGDGTFQTAVGYAIPPGAFRPAIADLNRDGAPDVLVGSDAFPFGHGIVSVLLGRGDGTLQAAVQTPSGNGSRLDVSDLDGDGNLDVAVTGKAGFMTVLPGNGDGTFAVAGDLPTSSAGNLIATGDMDRDGRTDVLLANGAGAILSILRNLGTPTSIFTARVDLDPSVILLGNRSTWLTAYIEPSGFRASDIVVSTVRLAGTVAAAPRSGVIADHDANGVPDLAVKFLRSSLDPLLRLGTNHLELTGGLVTGGLFRGSDDLLVRASNGTPRPVTVTPNPINPHGTLSFYLDEGGPVRVRVFDRGGRLVKTLLEQQDLVRGAHQVVFDGTNERGTRVASGVYFYRVDTPQGPCTGRLAVVK